MREITCAEMLRGRYWHIRRAIAHKNLNRIRSLLPKPNGFDTNIAVWTSVSARRRDRATSPNGIATTITTVQHCRLTKCIFHMKVTSGLPTIQGLSGHPLQKHLGYWGK